MDKKVLIVLPAYNEADSIVSVIKEVQSLDYHVTPLVVNDGSHDDTARLALAAGAKVVTHHLNLGIGGAVQTGFLYAMRFGYDYAVQVDGDGQHDVKYLKPLLDKAIHDQCDLVIGSRFKDHHQGFQSTAIRRLGIKFLSSLISGLVGQHVTDPTSGFRVYSQALMQSFAYYYPQDYPEPEAIVLANRLNLRIAEVPVVMRERQGGESSIDFWDSLYYMVKVTLAVLLDLCKHQKVLKPHG